MESDAEVVSLRRGRRVVASVFAWFFAVVAALPLFGLIDLGTTLGLANPAYRWSMSLEASWGSLFTFLVAGSFGWVGVVPRRPWPGLALLGLTAIGMVAGGIVLGDLGPLWVAVPLTVVTLGFALLLRPFVREGGPAWRVKAAPLTVVGAVGIPLWLGYTWNTYVAAVESPAGAGDVTMGIDHWPVQVALGLTLTVGSALLIGLGNDVALWRWSFGLTSIAVAWATLAYPDRSGAMPHPAWGVLIAVWGVLLALPSGRRSIARSSQPAL